MSTTDMSLPQVLIADNEEAVRGSLSALMEKEGLEPLQARDGEAALRIMRQDTVDVALLDIKMPRMNGMEVLAEAQRMHILTPVILIAASGCIESAVEAMKAGAWNYVGRPFDNEKLCSTIRNALKGRTALREPAAVPPQASQDSLLEQMGASKPMSTMIADIRLVAPTDFTVLITGETGAGKEVVARAIHQLSPRSKGPFVPVDCGSIPETLIESELFGHEKGSYTGAHKSCPGKFETASGGTLLLDEISNLPLSVQPNLLRALQEKKVWRVGGRQPIEVDIRVLASTNQDLSSGMRAGRFRKDLYYRLNEFSIRVPPLRERPEDIIFYAKRFLHLTKHELKKDVRGFSDLALQLLLAYDWPGHVRELRNIVRRAVLRCDTLIRPDHLSIFPSTQMSASLQPDDNEKVESNLPLKEIVRSTVMRVERNIIARVLKQTRGNKAEAARILQVDYKTIYNKMKRYGLSSSPGT